MPSIQAESQIPKGTTRVVIFDTNAYRNFIGKRSPEDARRKAAWLRQAEQAAGVLALANPFVIWELAAHLADVADLNYNECLAALTCLSEHTWNRADPPGGVCAFADPETTVCRELFRRTPPNAAQFVQNLCLIAAHIKNHTPPITDPPMINNLRVFAKKMAEMESRWLKDMQRILEGCSPAIAKLWIGGKDDNETRSKLRAFFSDEAFMTAWATSTVIRHAGLVQAAVRPEDAGGLVKAVREIFPAPFYLMSELLQKFPGPNPIKLNHPTKSRGNYVWDMAICFSIGGLHQVENANLYLVTADRPIIKAARAAKCADRVLSLKDYLDTLKSKTSP